MMGRPQFGQISCPLGFVNVSTVPHGHGVRSGSPWNAHIGLPDATEAFDGPDASVPIVLSVEGLLTGFAKDHQPLPVGEFVHIRQRLHFSGAEGDHVGLDWDRSAPRYVNQGRVSQVVPSVAALPPVTRLR
jgi:hypothetical protein